jgi:tetratricopeptide (TPR) repeat protein
MSEGPGTVIGPYKLLEQIGEGGFGVVFLAEQQYPVHRQVALKILKPGMDSQMGIARFEAERQALALMDHPNISRVLDAGTTDSGRPYFVMELVKGVPITDFCDQASLPIRERLELFVAVCGAVQHAHQKGVIHRDIKPSNVLVADCDGQPGPRLIDFGVARAAGLPLTDRTIYTRFAEMVGTPPYMSPEQAGMSSLGIDTRSDVYSLGVLLYELLTGTTPFDRERLRTADYDQMRRIIREEEPVKPSTRMSTLGQAASAVSVNRRSDPKRLRQLFRGELDWIVMKCLEKDRNRRYETAAALAADVRRHLHQESVLACPPTLRYRLRKFVRKHRGVVAAVAAIWLVLASGIIATTRAYWQARAAERQARQAEAEAQRTADYLTYDVFALAPRNAAGGRSREVTIREALDVAAPNIDHALGDDPRVEAAVRHVLGVTYRFLGEYDSAQLQLERAIAIRRRALGEEHPATLISQKNLCNVFYAQGRLARAEALALDVLHALRRQLPAGAVEIASTLALLGRILTARGEPKRAEPRLREALEIFSTALPREHWRTANVKSLLGACLTAQGRHDEAAPLIEAACRTLQSVPGAPRDRTRLALDNAVRLYEAWGKKDRADQWRKKRDNFGAPEQSGARPK